MTKRVFFCASVLAVVAVMSMAYLPAEAKEREKGRGTGPVVYVTGQDLFYDTIVGPDLPNRGPFQLLRMDGPAPDGLQTQYGPGDRGYVGGRWWVDANGSGEMDEGDKFFSCPLLGPGREEP